MDSVVDCGGYVISTILRKWVWKKSTGLLKTIFNNLRQRHGFASNQYDVIKERRTRNIVGR